MSDTATGADRERAQADDLDAYADTLDAHLECTSPAYGAPGHPHCAACCYGTMRIITNAGDEALADAADALRECARKLRTDAAEQDKIGARHDLARHIRVKLAGRELRPEVGQRMLTALDGGAEPDYQALWHAATWPPLAAVAYHTSATVSRAAIEAQGLQPCQPGTANWRPRPGTCEGIQASQPVAVYVCPEPDEQGMWAHWPAWHVWAINTEGVAWQPDTLNPGCWYSPEPIEPDRLQLLGTWPRVEL